MVPLSESQTMLDLMVELRLPIIVAALDSLGTINHTLLTLAALRAAGLEVLGVVFNRPEPAAGGQSDLDDLIRRDNPEIIARLGGAAVLGVLPHVPGLSAGGAAGEAAWSAVAAGFTGMPGVLSRLKVQ